MARRVQLLILSGLALTAAAFGQSPETAKPASSPADGGSEKQQPDFFHRRGPGHEGGWKKLDQLPPEERGKLIENFKRWQNMPPERRKEMMERLESRKQRMKAEIEEAINQSGLQLDQERREAFVSRYMQERRKIEEALRKEMEEKRKPLLEEMQQRLKTEFATTPAPAASPSAKPSPK